MHSVSRTRRLVVIALLSAVAAVLMIFPTLPMFGGFMKLDFSVVIVLIGMLIMDLPSALVILVLRSVIKVLIMNSGVNDWIGMPMNIIAMALFITSIWLFTRKSPVLTLKNYIIGATFGTVSLTIVMAFLNYVYAIPLYQKFANFSLASVGLNLKQWIVEMVLPFNLIQGIVLSFVTALVIFPILNYIKQQKVQLK